MGSRVVDEIILVGRLNVILRFKDEAVGRRWKPSWKIESLPLVRFDGKTCPIVYSTSIWMRS